MKILLPVDGSELALEAVRHALQLVRTGLRASFVLANVQEPPTFYEMMTVHDVEKLERVQASAAAHELAPAQALLEAADVPFEVEAGRGDVAHTLLDIAESQGCDAIVLAARGVGGREGARLGSVARALLDGSRLPLTLVWPVEDEAGEVDDEDAADDR